MLALRVAKQDANNIPHGQPGHVHGANEAGGKKKKAKKGELWNVAIVPQQEANDEFHYIWLFEGSQWKQKAYAALALVAVFAIVMFPLWPYTLRRGVWYLSMACLGLLGLFFGLAIVRLIIFAITIVAGPAPGIWIFPNLFEDVGFFDSFKPTWAWREVCWYLIANGGCDG
jgi:translocation protein SEC62